VACFLAVASAAASESSCRYKQYSPKLDRWYPVCRMPVSEPACEALAVTHHIGEVIFDERPCDPRGVAGVCAVGGEQILFYRGNAAELARGCEFLRGAWQPGARPAR
jgi:hypothetical protein